MADFRQLALDFVLSDEEAKQTSIAKQAAAELQGAPANSNPVARWVEAVQPWMPGSSGDEMADSQETPDWTARAKALEFLSRTLDFLRADLLKPSQVKLLVGFFGAMFDVDHKAGIMASATALSRIVAMKCFHPQSGLDIIDKVCALKDDFPRQISMTRLAVYELLRLLITDPQVAKDLQQKHGEASAFMHNLLQLCQNERDPDCLMVWFGILKYFLVEYNTSQEMLEEVYAAFKAYFPITLPRISSSGITPDELKLQLRSCFSSNYRLAALALPFLIGKLDQGDGVTVNVKVDVLKSIKACIEEYDEPDQSVTPYVNRIWGSLKYEVRNGEIEDTIWATLEVLKAVTTKLKGDDLRDYTLNVTRDCVSDLSSGSFASPAGRLLVSVLSANPSAFVMMVAPAVTHIKENLRHPKSPMHSQDLLRILRVILETRILLVNANMDDSVRSDFAAVDGVFKSLYEDVYRKPVELGRKEDASHDDIKTSTEAVQGAGALVRQQQLGTSVSLEKSSASSGWLLPQDTSARVCEALVSIVLQPNDEKSRHNGSDDLVNETTKALQQVVLGSEPCFSLLMDNGLAMIKSACEKRDDSAVETIQRIAPLIAFVGCSELPRSQTVGMAHFLQVVSGLHSQILLEVETQGSSKAWCALAAGMQSAVRYFNDACLQHSPDRDVAFTQDILEATIVQKYADAASSSSSAISVSEIRNDFLLFSLLKVANLYCLAMTKVDAPGQAGKEILQLSKELSGADETSENHYLHLVSDLACFILCEMSESQQLSLDLQQFVPGLFDGVVAPQDMQKDQQALDVEMSDGGSVSAWSWLTQERVNILFLGVLEALRPTVVARLFDSGIGQEILESTSVSTSSQNDLMAKPVTMSILAILANKYKIETLEPLMGKLEQQLAGALEQAKTSSAANDMQTGLDQASLLYAVSAGLLRRYSGKQAQGTLELLRGAPNHATVGDRLARKLETIVAPQKALTKENYAIVKPLWMQKMYFELVKPMLSTATGSNPDIQDPLIRNNFSIGVLLMVKHMEFSIYEEDSDKILRVSISIAQNMGTGPDALAALEVLKNILVEAPEKAQDQLGSLIKICTGSFSNRTAPAQNRPDWLPETYAPTTNDPQIRVGCGKLALEIIGGLPKLFESRHLLSYVPQVERELSVACGHRVRDLRKTARVARMAWSDVN